MSCNIGFKNYLAKMLHIFQFLAFKPKSQRQKSLTGFRNRQKRHNPTCNKYGGYKTSGGLVKYTGVANAFVSVQLISVPWTTAFYKKRQIKQGLLWNDGKVMFENYYQEIKMWKRVERRKVILKSIGQLSYKMAINR